MNIKICRIGAAALAAFACSGSSVFAAQDWPVRPIRLIVPFPAGSGNDIFGRLAGAKLAERLGKQVVVDNRGGAGGAIGTEIALAAPADGHTLLVISVAHAYTASIRKMAFDPVKSITPVAMMGTGPNALATHPAVPVKSVKDLMALAKLKPGQLNYASAGLGSFSHLSAELFRMNAGINAVHVPFNGGGPAMIAMVGGQADYIVGSLLQTLPYCQSRKLRALSVGSAQRNAALPDVPTHAEAGLAGFDANNWWGIVGPAGMPPAVVNRLNTEVSVILRSPDTRKWFVTQGAETIDMKPVEFHRWIAAEVAKWSEVVKNSGFKYE